MMTMPLICIKCRKPIPLSLSAMQEVSYTHYSYCEECLRNGLKAEKMLSWMYEWMGEALNAPCNYTIDGVDCIDCREYMIKKCDDWCDTCIGKKNAECWERFIKELYNEDQNIE